MTLPQNQASTQLGKHAIRQARNQASTKSSRLRLIISDRRAKIIQFTATKPANLIQLLQIFFGTNLITKHQKQFALIFQRALMLWIERQGRFIIVCRLVQLALFAMGKPQQILDIGVFFGRNFSLF